MKNQQNNEECKHCKLPISQRNPSGYCDHLYYPDNCDMCSGKQNRIFTVGNVVIDILVTDTSVVTDVEKWHREFDSIDSAIEGLSEIKKLIKQYAIHQ